MQLLKNLQKHWKEIFIFISSLINFISFIFLFEKNKEISELKTNHVILHEKMQDLMTRILNEETLKEKSSEILYKGWFFNDPISDKVAITLFVAGGLCLAGICIYYYLNNGKGGGEDDGGFGENTSNNSLNSSSNAENIILDKIELSKVQQSKEIGEIKETLEVYTSFSDEYFPKICDLEKIAVNQIESMKMLTEMVNIVYKDIKAFHKGDFLKFAEKNASLLGEFEAYMTQAMNHLVARLAILEKKTTEVIVKNIDIECIVKNIQEKTIKHSSFDNLKNSVGELGELIKNISLERSEPPIPSVLEINTIFCNFFNSLIEQEIFLFSIALFLLITVIGYSIHLNFIFLKKIKIILK